jgi:hypothetical protein
MAYQYISCKFIVSRNFKHKTMLLFKDAQRLLIVLATRSWNAHLRCFSLGEEHLGKKTAESATLPGASILV